MKKLIAITIGSTLMINLAFAFSDLAESHWAYKNVMDMQSRGIISGFNDNTFKPDKSLTREQFITMAVKGVNITNKIGKNIFADNTRWSKEYIDMAGSVLCDDGDTNFKPIDNALREDVAMALVRINNLEDKKYLVLFA